MVCSPPGSFVHGILQVRIPEWAVMPSSRGSSWPRDWTGVSYVSCTGRWVLFFFFFSGSMDYSPPGSSVHGILQARVLEWVAISFSRQVGSLPLVPPILSTLLNPVSSVLTTDDTHSSTGLHSERLLQPSQTVLHPGPVPGNWQCLLKHRKPSCRLLHCVGLLGSSVTSSSCLRLSFLCASNSTRSSLVSSSCYTATVLYRRVHKTTTTCRGCTHVATYPRHRS